MSGTEGRPGADHHARLREIEDEIEQAREAIAMAQGSATDPIVSDELDALQTERYRLLNAIQSADTVGEPNR